MVQAWHAPHDSLWTVGDAVVGRRNAGRRTSKSGQWATSWSAEGMPEGGHLRVDIPAHALLTARHGVPRKEDWERIFLLNRPSGLPGDPTGRGSELN